MHKVKTLLVGMLLGAMIASPIAWAASRKVLVSGNGTELGTTANPIIIQGV